MVLGIWNDSRILYAIVHHCIIDRLVVVLKQTMQEVWPAVETLLRAISLIRQSLLRWLSQDLLLTRAAIALSSRVTSDGNPDLVALFRCWNLEIVLVSGKQCFFCLLIGLIVTLLRQGYGLQAYCSLKQRCLGVVRYHLSIFIYLTLWA